MKTKCLLVDDEPIAIDVVRNHIARLAHLEISGVCTNAIEAFEFLNEHHVDLMFLDIQMPQITGLEFLRTLKNPPRVIIISAYREFALEGFELEVVDYLLKPVSFERFLKAIDKFYRTGHRRETGLSIKKTASKNDEFIWIRADRKNQKIPLDSIRYVEGLKDYVKIYLEDQMIISKTSMKKMEERLPEDRFARIHRSYLVSKNKIQAFTHEHVEIDNNLLPIGVSYRSAVMNLLS